MIDYLSPSSFAEWRTCPHKFYLKRMCGQYVVEPTSMAMAVGTAFDAIVCNAVAKELGLDTIPEYGIEFNTNDIPAAIRATAINKAEYLFSVYKSTGAFKNLLALDIGAIHPYAEKIITDENGREVSVYSKPDLFTKFGTPIELKVQGADSNYGASPHPGYCIALFNNGKSKFGHERSHEPLETLNLDWAYQLCIYDFTYSGVIPFRKRRVIVEHIAVRKDTVACSRIDTFINKEFNERVFNELVTAWSLIRTGQIPLAEPSKDKCHKYNSVCAVAEQCSSYTQITLDPTLKALLF